jgi:O-antigen ligase
MAGLAAAAAMSPKIYEQFTVRSDSATVRFYQYEAAFRMILDHPILGVGLNNATGDKPKYVNVTYNRRDSNTQFYLEPTHNMYLALTSEIGIAGALIFFGFFTRIAVLAWRQSRHSPDPEIRWIASALFLTFVSVGVSGLMDPFQEHATLFLLWIYAGITLNLPRMAESKGAHPAGARQEVGQPRPGRSRGPRALNPSQLSPRS